MATQRVDLYAKVTDQIIAQLEAGCLPWVQPWKAGVGSAPGRNVALPHNAHTGRRYSGINIPLLWAAGAGYGSHGWLTFKQAIDLGGHVRKGEKGSMVVFADRFVSKAETTRAAESGDKARQIWFLKNYTVFNREQCDGLAAEPVATLPSMPTLCERANSVIVASGAKLSIGGDKAFYMPSIDSISVPNPEAYAPDVINWYRTTLHELAHWTGAKHRLNRDFSGRFGDSAYAREELVAEMSAAFTCASLGIAPTVRHADYIGSWLKVLKGDKRAIFQAASHASKATDMLLAFEAQQPAAIAA